MNRADLIDRLTARAATLTTEDVELSVSLILDSLSHTLASNDRIEIRGFGSFTLSYRPSRQGRNPASGESVQVPAKYLPKFKVGKTLRDRVDCMDDRSPLATIIKNVSP